MKLYVQSEPDKMSGPVGGSQGLESRCQKDPIDFASMLQTLREKKHHLSSHNIVLHLIFMKTTIQEEYFLPASAYSSF